MEHDPQLGSFYVCERCHHVFERLPDAPARCPRCHSDFVAKFRQSHLSNYKYNSLHFPPAEAID